MKRLLFVATLLLSASFSPAFGHIRFMGIELSGCYENFKDSLTARGFTYLSSYETLHKFYGKFANEMVIINILATPITNTVCKVIVYFPEKEEWQDLKSDYFYKKELYESKYILDEDYEFFSSPYEDGDGYEMRAISKDKCHYISFFKVIGGSITVKIERTQQVKIIYEDDNNINKAHQEIKHKAIDDI